MAVPFVSVDLFALATLATRADEAEGPPPTKFYELRDNLRTDIEPFLQDQLFGQQDKLAGYRLTAIKKATQPQTEPDDESNAAPPADPS
jgi:hypothetical protein